MNGFSNSGRKPQRPKEARTSCETVAEARVDNICNNSNTSSICNNSNSAAFVAHAKHAAQGRMVAPQSQFERENNSNNSNILDLASIFFSFPLFPNHEALNP